MGLIMPFFKTREKKYPEQTRNIRQQKQNTVTDTQKERKEPKVINFLHFFKK